MYAAKQILTPNLSKDVIEVIACSAAGRARFEADALPRADTGQKRIERDLHGARRKRLAQGVRGSRAVGAGWARLCAGLVESGLRGVGTGRDRLALMAV